MREITHEAPEATFTPDYLERKEKANRKFIKINANYVPDDICTYPEYKGKPYYSILYEENGQRFEGFSSYSLEVLSSYLREYFFEDKENK